MWAGSEEPGTSWSLQVSQVQHCSATDSKPRSCFVSNGPNGLCSLAIIVTAAAES